MASSVFRVVRVTGLATGAALLYGFFRSARRKSAPETTGEAQWEPLTTETTPVPARSGPVTFAIDLSDDNTDSGDSSWVAPLDDGSCPPDWPLKGNDGSKIFHAPGGMSYDRTIAERCYQSEGAAEADGYRKAKR